MPNNTANVLMVTGVTDVLHEFVASVVSEESAFDFQKILPCPQELRDATSPAAFHIDQQSSGGATYPLVDHYARTWNSSCKRRPDNP